MSNNYRELTGREKQRIKKLITSLCANYDKEYGCLPLDYNCPMFGISFTNSALCRKFRSDLLPEAPELQSVFEPLPLAVCKECGKSAKALGKAEIKHHVTVLPSESLVSQGFFEGILHWQGVIPFT